jgi:hypothetical protein
MPRIDRTPIPDEVFREVAEQIVASEQRADPTPPPAPPIEVLRAARDWAAEHRHQIPDDRMLAIVYAAGRTAAAAQPRIVFDEIAWYADDRATRGRSDTELRAALESIAKIAKSEAARITEGTETDVTA